jgi:hypothetical protein
MQKEKSIRDWKRMYDSLTNPDSQAKARRDIQKDKRKKEKQSDTGL